MRIALRFALLGLALLLLQPYAASPRRAPAAPADAEQVLAVAASALHLGDDDAVIARRLRRNADFLCLDDGAAFGLADTDLVVQRRLATRLRLAIEAQARAAEPTDDELRAWVESHRAAFATPARVDVTQVFFSRARRGDATARDASRGVAALRRGDAVRGDPLPVPSTLSSFTAEALAALLGADVARAAFASAVGDWTEPVPSPFGLHLLRVTARQSPRLPPLDEIRAAAREQLLAARGEAAVTAALRELRGGR